MIKKRIRTRQENQIREKKAKMTVLYGLSSVRIEWVSRQQTIQEHLKEQERMISERQWKPGYSFHDFFATALVFPRLSSFILSRKTTKYLFGWSFRVDWCYGFCCIRVSCIPDQTSHLMIRIFVKTPRLEVPRIEVTNEISERNLRLTTLSGCVVSHNSFRLNWGSYSWTFCVKLHSWNPRL